MTEERDPGSYSSPVHKLLRFFKKSRDQWKNKCRKAKAKIKEQRRRIKVLETRQKELKQRIQELKAEGQKGKMSFPERTPFVVKKKESRRT